MGARVPPLPFIDAEAIVMSESAAHRMPAESVVLSRAHGRIIAQDVTASIPLPPFDNSAMDGFALRHADLPAPGGLLLVGEQFAGCSRQLAIAAGQCVRITTGAPLPTGADTVLIKESARVGDTRVFADACPRAGAHVRRAGEDARQGSRLLSRGSVLTPACVAIAAASGHAALQVFQRPTVAVFTTGDELIEPGIALQPGEIYNSNRELLMGLLRGDGLEPTAWPTIPDDPARLASALHDACASFDVVITCGAVSAGEKDHIPAIVREQGQVLVWKVAMKPGMPVLCGRIGRGFLLGLPGNPVSVLATYLTLARALFDGLQGRVQPRPSWTARLSMAFDKQHARREFLRGRLMTSADGVLLVEPDPADGSHRLAAAARANVLIVLPEGERRFQVDDCVRVLPY